MICQGIIDGGLAAARKMVNEQSGGKAGGGGGGGGKSNSEPGGGKDVIELTEANWQKKVMNSENCVKSNTRNTPGMNRWVNSLITK